MKVSNVKNPGKHLPSAVFLPKLLVWCGCFLVFLGAIDVRGADLPPSFVLKLPVQASEPLPIWLGAPQTLLTTFAMLNLPVQPPNPDASLLVTVYFQEKQGGFLRVVWQGAQTAQALTDNLYEGIGMDNQRSLLISPQTLAGGGNLNFQCGDTVLGIQRIKLEWLATQSGLVSPQIQDLLVTPETGPTQPGHALTGQPVPPDPAAWKGQVVSVPMTDCPQRIEQGVEFSIQLDAIPALGKISLKEAGLPLSKHLIVWINQKRAGTITPVVPDLLDPGFLADVSPDTYVGWRDGSFMVPVSLLQAGVNTVQFSTEEEIPSADAKGSDATTGPVEPLALKGAVIQFSYTQPPPAPVETTPASSDPSAATPPAPVTSGELLPAPGEISSPLRPIPN